MKNILVVYGGKSSEHEVSIMSAKFIITKLKEAGYNVLPLRITKDGRWIFQDSEVRIKTTGELVTLNASKLLAKFDLIFPIVHGSNGEDGRLQGYFEMLNLPYVGPDVLSAAVAMDKDLAKRLILNAGIKTSNYLTLYLNEWNTDADHHIDYINKSLVYPLFVKPANTGSSIGISKVTTKQQLKSALDLAFEHDYKILIEEEVVGREIEVAVLGNCSQPETIEVSVPGEVVPRHEFYSYNAKYIDKDGAQLYFPAKLSKDQTKKVRELALAVFKSVAGMGMARVDFLFDEQEDEFYFNEANTVPGFTAISMYPKLFELSGISNKELVSRLVKLGEERYQEKNQLKKTI